MSDKRLADIKGELVRLIAAVPQGYGDGALINSNDAKRVATYILEDFFLVARMELPVVMINESNLTALVSPTYVTTGELDADDNPDLWWDNITATIMNYLSVCKIQELKKEQDEQDRKDTEFAFTLFKSSDPANLHYTSWNHLSRFDQQRWLNVARKAREELKDNK